MSEPIKISGELTPDPDVCHFHIGRNIVEDVALIFQSAADSKGSPLIDKLFAIEGIQRILVSGETITITKNLPAPWPHLAADIAKAIKESFSGEAPPIAPIVVDEIKNASMDGVEQGIAELFEDEINPALASHGGFVRLVKIENRDVYVEMGGGCQGCAASQATLRYGVESAIRRIAPQVRNIVDATNHAAGVNPYYK